jgi:hypothetical protein
VEKQEKFEEEICLKLSSKSSFQFLSMSVRENKSRGIMDRPRMSSLRD